MTSEFLLMLGKTWEVTNLFLSSDVETSVGQGPVFIFKWDTAGSTVSVLHWSELQNHMDSNCQE